MSSFADITSVSVDGQEDIVFGNPVTEIVIEDALLVPSIELQVPNEITTIEIAVEGPQGPPGVQNVFVQSTAPTSPNLNDIWIQV